MVVGGAQSIFPSRSSPRFQLSFSDFVGQVGYVTYDGVRTNNQATNEYILFPSAAANTIPEIDSSQDDDLDKIHYTNWSINGNTQQDFDFDLSPFLLPVRIQGKLILRFTIAGDDSNDTSNFQAKAIIRKWDGSSETDLGSDLASAITLTGGDLASMFMTIDIPLTHFKIGEQLRVSLEITYTDPMTATRDLALAHNPQDTAVTTPNTTPFIEGGTRFIVAVPYRLP